MALNNLTRIGNSGFGTDTSINTTGIVTAASFSGDGSGLTGITAVGSGVVVREEGSNVGTAQTINFIGTGVTATISGGIASIEIATSGGGGGGLSDIVSDTTPQLGGNLDLNSKNITGTGVTITPDGNAAFSGIVTAFDLDVDGHTNLDNVSVVGVSTFNNGVDIKSAIYLNGPGNQSDLYIGSSNQVKLDHNGGSAMWSNTVGLSYISTKGGVVVRKEGGGYDNIIRGIADGAVELYNDNSKKFETTSTGAIVTGTLVATATTATNVTVANEASDTECFVMFGVNATGNNAPKSSSSLKYNSSSGGLTAGSFIGDGSGLTGITASGSGVIVRDGGSLVGTAGTIDFGSNVSVSPISAGVVTVTASAGSIAGINTSGTTELNNLTVAGVSTFTDNVILNANLDLQDDDKILLGSGDDLEIYHTGSHSFIVDSGVGSLYIRASAGNIQDQGNANQSWLQFNSGAGVEAHFAGNKKFETLGAGVTVTGTTFSNQLSVSGVSTFNGTVDFNGAVDFNDAVDVNAHVEFKAASGNSSLYMYDENAINLGSNNDARLIYNNIGNIVKFERNGSAGEIEIDAAPVTLKHSDSTKLQTSSTGVTVTGSVTATSFSGSGANLTNLPSPTPADTDVQVTYDISANGNNYRITGPGYDASESNPDLYLVRGQRYRFINGTGSGHPFRIQSDTSGTAYTDGVSGSQSGTQDFNVQNDAPVRLYYQCTIHSGMIGNIYIVGASDWRMTDVATNATPDIFTNLNVGIGTDTPGAILEVFDATSNTIVNVKSGDAGAVLNLIDNSARSSIEQTGSTLKIISDTGAEDADSDIRLQVDGSTKMLINSSGVVQIGDAGLGSDNGDRKLDIIGSGNGQAGLLIANNATSASGTCDISFAPSNKVTGAQIICEAQEDFSSSANRTADLTFQTRKDGTLSEKLRIGSDGSVGVGKNNPDVTLHIGGAAVTMPEVKLHRTSSYDNAWRFFQSHYGANDYGTLFIRPTLATTPNVEITNSSGAMAMRVDSDTGVISVKNGGGINFGSNPNASGMTSEVLDDYEEGTWTANTANSITLHSTVNLCSYTKIGRQVTVTGQIRVDNNNSGAALIINNMPFNCATSTEGESFSVGAVRLYNAGITGTAVQVICISDAGTNNILFKEVRDNASDQNVQATQNGYYMFTLTYFTA